MKFLFLILILLAIPVKAQFDYYPPENQHHYYHMAASASITVSSYYIYRYLHQSKTHQKVLRLLYPIYEKPQLTYITSAILTGLAIGTVKELIDMQKNKTFNMKDMQYNFIGSQIGITYIFFFEFDFDQYP